MQNKIRVVKERANIFKVAEYFNIHINRNNMALCCFHKEKSPSLSFSHSKQIFHCFGCGVGGDCITLVSKLLNINAYESAKQINNIFCLGVDFGQKTSSYELNKYKQTQEAKKRFKEWHNKTFILLCDYYRSLEGIERLQQQDIVEYYIDLLTVGTEEDWLWFKKTEERWCKEIERRFKSKNVGVQST